MQTADQRTKKKTYMFEDYVLMIRFTRKKLPMSFSIPYHGRRCRIAAVRVAALIVIAVALFAASPAVAQQEKGDVELEFLGSLTTTVGAEEGSGFGVIQSKLGRFVTDQWQLGAFPSLEVRFAAGTTDTKLGGGLFAVYSFLRPDAMTAPYAGASFYKSDVTAGFGANDYWTGVNGGLKFYMDRNIALDMGGNYLFSLSGIEGKGHLLIMQAGLSFLF